MDDLMIQTHSFEEAKNQLKIFSEEATTDLELRKVDSDKGFGEFIGDLIFGRGFGLDHKVTGSELNSLTAQIQKHLIKINETQRSFINEFGQVYNALEALDKDYIPVILSAVKSAQKANSKVKIAQNDIEKTITEQKKIIKVLKQFKEKLDQYKHIEDIDFMWDNIISTNKKVTSLSETVDGLIKYCEEQLELKKGLEKLKVENSTKDERILDLCTRLDEEHQLLDKMKSEWLRKMKILYYLAGGALSLVVIESILLVLGMI